MEFELVCDNANESNETSDVWLIPDSDRTGGLVTAVFLLLILVTALPWNLLVVVIILKEKLFKQPTILLLLNLVVTDLIIVLLLLPFEIATGIQGEFRPGQPDSRRCIACDVGLTIAIFTLMSLLTVAFMSFDRFLFIYKPLRYDKIMTSLRVLIVLSVMWVISTVTAVLPLFKFGTIVFFSPFLSCTFDFTDDSQYPILILVMVGLTITFIVVFNLWVAVIVQKNIRKIYQTRKMEGDGVNGKADKALYKRMRKKRHDKELHLIKVFGGLLCSNLVTWLPLMSISFYVFISKEIESIPGEVWSTFHVLFLSQVMFHPFVETALIREVKEPIKKLLWCCCRRRKTISLTGKEESSSGHNHRHGEEGRSSSKSCGCGFLVVLGAVLLPQHSTNNDDSKGKHEMSSHHQRSVVSSNLKDKDDEITSQIDII